VINMPEQRKLPKGQARIQFIANLERINKLSAQGYDIAKIFRELKEKKLISMSYTSFHDNFARNRSSFRKKVVSSHQPARSPAGPPIGRLPDPAKGAEKAFRQLAEEKAQRQRHTGHEPESTLEQVIGKNHGSS